jgi:hypothetical protein
MEGSFRQRYNNTGQFEFKVSKMYLLETAKSLLTREIAIDTEPQFLNEEMVEFFNNNLRQYPGSSKLSFHLTDTRHQNKVNLFTSVNGIAMNDDLVQFLQNNPDLNVNVYTFPNS